MPRQLSLFELAEPLETPTPPTNQIPDQFPNQLTQLLHGDDKMAFAKACEEFLRQYLRDSPKSKQKPKLALKALFSQFPTPEDIDTAQWRIADGVHKRALNDFYVAGNEVISQMKEAARV